MKAGIFKLPRVRGVSNFRSISPSIRAVAEFAVKMKSRASQKDGMFGLSEYDRQVKMLGRKTKETTKYDRRLEGLGRIGKEERI
jgi:hypothetical protein